MPVDRVSETLRFLQVGLAGFPPQKVRVWREGQAARDRILHAQAGPDAAEASCVRSVTN
jgi:hypothetical protein